jgi:4-hydroxy-3-polyprenylbenzoate decarboxylase
MRLPDGFGPARLVAPGIVAVTSPPHAGLEAGEYEPGFERFARDFRPTDARLPLVVLTDDADFTADRFANFLWEAFTRANPATDVLGVGGETHRKHYGCAGPLVLDARLKPHMAPPLLEDPAVTRRVDELCARGGPLHGVVK